MKKIILLATMMAITMGAFAQTEVTDEDSFQSTTGTFNGYLGYSNSELLDIMEKAVELADDAGYNPRTLGWLLDMVYSIDKNNRAQVLDKYEEYMFYVPTYLEKATKLYFLGEE